MTFLYGRRKALVPAPGLVIRAPGAFCILIGGVGIGCDQAQVPPPLFLDVDRRGQVRSGTEHHTRRAGAAPGPEVTGGLGLGL